MKKDSGLTLLELLIAFIIFILLIMALVSFSATSLDIWSRGEMEKNIYDRAQIILSTIEDDLRNIFIERQITSFPTDSAPQVTLPAYFECTLDKNKNQVLKFVRLASNNDSLKKSNPLTPSDMIFELHEVIYLLDAEKNTLCRGIRYFDRNRKKTFYQNEKIDKKNFFILDSGILDIEFKFWSQITNAWSKSQASKPAEYQEPLSTWDSLRNLTIFKFHKRRANIFDPDYMYPEIIRVSIILKQQFLSERKVFLMSNVDETTMILQANNTQDLPDPPYYLKIGPEWIEYKEKKTGIIVVSKRGAKQTKPQKHDTGKTLEFGETFFMDIYIPTYMEAIYK